jgi:two-component system, chemotaxis family, chemotaxis protein CheY
LAAAFTKSIDFQSLRLLVVDDQPNMRRVFRSLLAGFGAREIEEASDGAAALEMISSFQPDIVILDWVMPVLDGIEVTRLVRKGKDSANPFVPIIMVSAHGRKDQVILARDAGVTEYLTKPVSAKALYDRVVNIVLNPRPFIEAKGYFGPDRRRFVNPNYAGQEKRVDEQPDPDAHAAQLMDKLAERVVKSTR